MLDITSAKRMLAQQQMLNCLIPKETRAGETRVALIPSDAALLIQRGVQVFLEHDAGVQAGFTDHDYERLGVRIRFLQDESLTSYAALFEDINLIVRVKRAAVERERLEIRVMQPGTVMMGALDPLESNSSHRHDYQSAGLIPLSIDQLDLPVNDPMNVLAAMSRIAGRLAMIDAVEKCQRPIHKVVILGYGVIGQAAFAEARQQGLSITVMLSNAQAAAEIIAQGGHVVLLAKQDALAQQQMMVCDTLLDADVVISSARHANQQAPLLIPETTLACMQPGSVIVDMALSEGGNVAGSEHDATVSLGNGVLVTNVSGYPKAAPHLASQWWSSASRHFLCHLLDECMAKLLT